MINRHGSETEMHFQENLFRNFSGKTNLGCKTLIYHYFTAQTVTAKYLKLNL